MFSFRKILIILLLFAALTACRSDEPEAEVAAPPLPTLMVTPSGEIDKSPRQQASPTSSIPPTWTPGPIPVGHPTSAPKEPDPTYTVQEGDTLGGIAEFYGVSVAVLADANDISNVDLIEPGQIITIPAGN